VLPRLLLGYLTLLDQCGHQGMVTGQVPQGTLPVEVGARVADVADVSRVTLAVDQRQGRSHLAELRAGGSLGVDRRVCGRHRLLDQLLAGDEAEVVLDVLAHDSERHRASDLAGLVSAHAVGDGEEVAGLEDGVLVYLADFPRIGQR
jgi:hypothetical protein